MSNYCTCTFYDLVGVGFKPSEILGHTERCLITPTKTQEDKRKYWRDKQREYRIKEKNTNESK